MSWKSQLHKEIQFEATKSGGPGGQNVNKTSSAVRALWAAFQTSAFDEQTRERIAYNLRHRTNSSGLVVIRSDEFRDQLLNKRKAVQKLERLIEEAMHVAKPRKPTRPRASSKAERVKSKKLRGEVKQNRKKVEY